MMLFDILWWKFLAQIGVAGGGVVAAFGETTTKKAGKRYLNGKGLAALSFIVVAAFGALTAEYLASEESRRKFETIVAETKENYRELKRAQRQLKTDQIRFDCVLTTGESTGTFVYKYMTGIPARLHIEISPLGDVGALPDPQLELAIRLYPYEVGTVGSLFDFNGPELLGRTLSRLDGDPLPGNPFNYRKSLESQLRDAPQAYLGKQREILAWLARNDIVTEDDLTAYKLTVSTQFEHVKRGKKNTFAIAKLAIAIGSHFKEIAWFENLGDTTPRNPEVDNIIRGALDTSNDIWGGDDRSVVFVSGGY